MSGFRLSRSLLTFASLSLVALTSVQSRADDPFGPARGGLVVSATTPVPVQRGVIVYPTTVARPQPRMPATLGTFTATPYMFVRGNGPAGGGYSPMNEFGESTMVMYGPLAAQRFISAPVYTYSRGYNGETVVTPGTSFSTPNSPGLTPVVYPTQASNYFGFRTSGTPPWWPSAINWIDQN